MATVKLTAFVEKMKLENLTPEVSVSKIKISQPDINRPALQLTGYFEHFEETRIQVIGFVEYTYMQNNMSDEQKEEIYAQLFSYIKRTVGTGLRLYSVVKSSYIIEHTAA